MSNWLSLSLIKTVHNWLPPPAFLAEGGLPPTRLPSGRLPQLSRSLRPFPLVMGSGRLALLVCSVGPNQPLRYSGPTGPPDRQPGVAFRFTPAEVGGNGSTTAARTGRLSPPMAE